MSNLQQKYETWRATAHGAEIFRLFKRFAFEALNVDRKTQFGAKAIAERVRWFVHVENPGVFIHGELFKVNNNYTSRMVRELIAEDPRFEGFFQLRELKA
jgi:hypothetical protein